MFSVHLSSFRLNFAENKISKDAVDVYKKCGPSFVEIWRTIYQYKLVQFKLPRSFLDSARNDTSAVISSILR